MNKALALAIVLALTASVSFADDTASSSSDSGKWQIQLQGGMAVPTSSDLANFTATGYSFEGSIGYAMDKHLTIGLRSGLDETFTQAQYGSGGGINHIPLIAFVQINADMGGWLVPYIIFGSGVAFDYSTGFLPSTTNFEFDSGFGFSFKASNDLKLFLQAIVENDFNNTPGGTTGAFALTPLTFVPVQLGVNFSL